MFGCLIRWLYILSGKIALTGCMFVVLVIYLKMASLVLLIVFLCFGWVCCFEIVVAFGCIGYLGVVVPGVFGVCVRATFVVWFSCLRLLFASVVFALTGLALICFGLLVLLTWFYCDVLRLVCVSSVVFWY